jgi:hypothetical protein
MKLYTHNGQWFGTQADARKGGASIDPIEVPVDKAGLLEFLNAHRVGHAPGLTVEPQAPTAAPVPTAGPTLSPRHALFEAAAEASLQDLQHVVYRYMMAIDDAFDLQPLLEPIRRQ